MRDERAILGFLLLHLLIAVPGALLLMATGLLRAAPRALLAAAGPAFLAGVVVVALPLVVLLTAGVTVTPLASLAAWAMLTAVLAVPAVRRLRRPEPPLAPGGSAPARAEQIVIGVLVAGLAVYFAFAVVAFAHLPTLWDDANIWSLKGYAIYHHSSLVPEVFRNPDFSHVHVDYPVMHPFLEASFFHGIGEIDSRLWHSELWILLAAAIWTLGWLLAPLGRRRLWVVVPALVAVSPVILVNVTLGDADTTMAAFVGVAAVCFGLWVQHGRTGHAIVGALFLAAAANVKNEGLAFGVAILAALLLVALIARPRPALRDLALALGLFAVLVIPWQIWVIENPAAVRATPSPWEIFTRPDYFVDRLSLLWRGFRQVLQQLVTTASWGLMVPAFLVLASGLWRFGRFRRVVGFYVGAWLLAWLAVAYTYWVTPIADVAAFEGRTGPRIVLGVVFILAAGLAHLLAVSVAALEPEADATAETEALDRPPVTAGAPAR